MSAMTSFAVAILQINGSMGLGTPSAVYVCVRDVVLCCGELPAEWHSMLVDMYQVLQSPRVESRCSSVAPERRSLHIFIHRLRISAVLIHQFRQTPPSPRTPTPPNRESFMAHAYARLSTLLHMLIPCCKLDNTKVDVRPVCSSRDLNSHNH
jgi:hypothetical protein